MAVAELGGDYALFDPHDPFEMRAGPFLYRREAGGELVFALVAEARHCNSHGIVHGGLMMTMADLCISAASRQGTDDLFALTISMNTDFLSSARAGEVIECRGRVLRRTGSLAFVAATMTAAEDGRPLLNVNAVLKRIRPKRDESNQ